MSAGSSFPGRAAARARRRKRERGVALIMVLGAIAIMIVMLAEFQDDAGAEFAAATAARDGTQAEYFARSSIALERLLIASEPTMRAAITPLFMLMKQTPPQLPVWEYSDRILGAFNDQDGSKDFSSLSGLDLSLSKELMSAMAPIQYDPLFTQRDSTGNYNDRLTICSAIIDWADSDEQLFSCDLTSSTGSNAVEDSWYQLLAKPYRRKNAPYDSLEELHMARGISDDFWATFVDPDPTEPRKRIMTVWGQGTVNVNSANPATLYGLVCAGAPTAEMCTDPMQMQLFVMGMTMAKGITMGAPIFSSPKDFINAMEGKGMLGPMLTLLGLKPVKFQSESDFAKSLSVESKVFSIYAVGAVKGFRRDTRVKIHTVVDFRNVQPLTGGGAAPSSTATPGAAPTAGGQQVTTPGASSGITAALQPNIGGQTLYYEIE
jgi:general secretion pathway protein K